MSGKIHQQIKWPQRRSLHVVPSMFQAIWGSLNAASLVRQHQYPWDCINFAASKIDATSEQWGYFASIRLPLNTEALSQQWGCLKTIRLHHNNMTASQQWGCLTTIGLPHNDVAASQQCGCLTTNKLAHKYNIKTVLQQLRYLTKLRLQNNIGIAPQW